MESSDPEQEGGGNVDALLAESSPQEYLNPRSFPSSLSLLLPFLQVSSFNSSEELVVQQFRGTDQAFADPAVFGKFPLMRHWARLVLSLRVPTYLQSAIGQPSF